MAKIKIHRDLSVISDDELNYLFSKTQKNLLKSRGKSYKQRRRILQKLDASIQKEIRNRPHLITDHRPDIEINFDLPNPFIWLKKIIRRKLRNLRYH